MRAEHAEADLPASGNLAIGTGLLAALTKRCRKNRARDRDQFIPQLDRTGSLQEDDAESRGLCQERERFRVRRRNGAGIAKNASAPSRLGRSPGCGSIAGVSARAFDHDLWTFFRPWPFGVRFDINQRLTSKRPVAKRSRRTEFPDAPFQDGGDVAAGGAGDLKLGKTLF